MTTPGSSLTVTGVGPRGPHGPGILMGHGLPGVGQNALNARSGDTYFDLDTGRIYGPFVRNRPWPAVPLFVPGPGIDPALLTDAVGDAVTAAVAALPPSGLTAIAVEALIDAALAAAAAPPSDAAATPAEPAAPAPAPGT